MEQLKDMGKTFQLGIFNGDKSETGIVFDYETVEQWFSDPDFDVQEFVNTFMIPAIISVRKRWLKLNPQTEIKERPKNVRYIVSH